MTTKPDDSAAKIRRTYGRGLYDGMRLVGITNPEEYMNNARLMEAEKKQNGIARKVLDAVSTQETMAASKVCGELRRNGHNVAPNVVLGCLNTLKGEGLLKEPRPGEFIRVPMKPEPVSLPAPVVTLKPTPEPEPPKAAEPAPQPVLDPLERLALLAATARAMSAEASRLAAEIEETAFGVEDRIQQIRAEVEKFDQLRTLLKSIKEAT